MGLVILQDKGEQRLHATPLMMMAPDDGRNVGDGYPLICSSCVLSSPRGFFVRELHITIEDVAQPQNGRASVLLQGTSHCYIIHHPGWFARKKEPLFAFVCIIE